MIRRFVGFAVAIIKFYGCVVISDAPPLVWILCASYGKRPGYASWKFAGVIHLKNTGLIPLSWCLILICLQYFVSSPDVLPIANRPERIGANQISFLATGSWVCCCRWCMCNQHGAGCQANDAGAQRNRFTVAHLWIVANRVLDSCLASPVLADNTCFCYLLLSIVLPM